MRRLGRWQDLMFSHPDDPASVTQVRERERAHIRQWIVERSVRRQQEKLRAASASPAAGGTSRKELS